MLTEMSGGHSHVARIQLGQEISGHVFMRGAEELTIELGAPLVGQVAQPSEAARAPAPTGWWGLFWAFLGQGVVHILLGLDHVLFVVSLAWAVRGLRELAGVVTAFTLAHSLTLALGALDLVALEPAWVESAIALSILYVALENILVKEPKGRYVVAFLFGLVHGFGFSYVLRDLGLPEEGVLPSLLAFNLGVELGQLALVAPLLPLVLWLRKRDEARGARWHRAATVAVSACVGVVALVWFIERAFGLSLLPWGGG
jgi:hydrogenase/urease accessory protein HupE